MTEPVNLSVERRNRGLSKAAMAKWIGIGHATWCAAEKGESIAVATQKKIADKLGHTVVEVFPDTEVAAAWPVEPLSTGKAAA